MTHCFWSMVRVSAGVVVSSRCSVTCWLVCLKRSLFLEVAVSLRSVCVYIVRGKSGGQGEISAGCGTCESDWVALKDVCSRL